MSNLPTLYEYYTSGGISNGLSTDLPYFTLNNRNISIYSGSMHYFRVPNGYWRDRLRKMRAAGLNAVQTYIPWNLHEPQPGMYEFGHSGTDMQDFLDIEKFLRTAQEEDLFVIARPGPYICAEFDFGGMPSWLLREDGIKVRTSDEKYMKHVRRYFNVLLTLLASFQFMNGGPIISFQVENEYGSMTDLKGKPPFIPDLVYLEELRQLMLSNKITELMFTSDSPYDVGSNGTLPTLFQTANFDEEPEKQFQALSQIQGQKPYMATEFYSGWFSHWAEPPYKPNITEFVTIYEEVLKYPASVNLYMFHGGTNFGFLNGANKNNSNQSSLQPTMTSYDYDAPLTEYGDYNLKYFIVKDLLVKYNQIVTKLPEMPSVPERVALPNLTIMQFLSYEDIINQLPYIIPSKELLAMENLPINNNTGQSFGYILYRKKLITIPKGSVLRIMDNVFDHVNVYINDNLISHNVFNLSGFGYWRQGNSSIILSPNDTIENATLDLVIENSGRCNYGRLHQFEQSKGLRQRVLLNGEDIFDWEIFPMEFKQAWIKNLVNWKPFEMPFSAPKQSGLYKAEVFVEVPFDTFLDMRKWHKGIVIVNNFVLGRYWKIGPQQTLYLPGPLLTFGVNEIIIFEEFLPGKDIVFSRDPIHMNIFQ